MRLIVFFLFLLSTIPCFAPPKEEKHRHRHHRRKHRRTQSWDKTVKSVSASELVKDCTGLTRLCRQYNLKTASSDGEIGTMVPCHRRALSEGASPLKAKKSPYAKMCDLGWYYSQSAQSKKEGGLPPHVSTPEESGSYAAADIYFGGDDATPVNVVTLEEGGTEKLMSKAFRNFILCSMGCSSSFLVGFAVVIIVIGSEGGLW